MHSIFYVLYIFHYIKRTFPPIGRQYTRTYHVSNTYPTHIHISTISSIQHPKTPHCEDVDERRRKNLLPTRSRVRARVCVMWQHLHRAPSPAPAPAPCAPRTLIACYPTLQTYRPTAPRPATMCNSCPTGKWLISLQPCAMQPCAKLTTLPYRHTPISLQPCATHALQANGSSTCNQVPSRHTAHQPATMCNATMCNT